MQQMAAVHPRSHSEVALKVGLHVQFGTCSPWSMH